MNKKILLIGTSTYILVVAVTGFLLFAKQSPLAWVSTSNDDMNKVCFNLNGEEVCGITDRASRFFENKDKPNDEFFNEYYKDTDGNLYKNNIAIWVNNNLAIATVSFVLASVVYFGLIFTSARRRNE